VAGLGQSVDSFNFPKYKKGFHLVQAFSGFALSFADGSRRWPHMAKEENSINPTADKATLANLRTEIDRIDGELVRLMNARARLAHDIGQIKNNQGLECYSPAREEEVLARVVQANQGPLGERCLRAVFRELISGSRAVETLHRVAYLGPEYTYSHLAAIHRFGQSVEFLPVSTISAVFEEVERKQANFGIVPLENSTDGRIADTLDMFTRSPVKICGEVQLRIHHNLLGVGDRASITDVYSKPQALSQCRNWLARHLPTAQMHEVTSTGEAAHIAQQKPHAAAIASVQAAVNYGLNVLAADIEDVPGNTTRFAVIGHVASAHTGNDKCAIMFEVPHQPGALADAMLVFKNANLNLTWIESFPIARPGGGYLFFVEIEGHENDAAVTEAVAILRQSAVRLEVLGSYAKTAIVG
jgi:chorismate mutase/prephenate dehydratase